MSMKKQYLTKAAELRRRVDKGLIKNKEDRHRAIKYIAQLKWKAKQSDKPKATKDKRKETIVPKQGFLPNFLIQMDMVRIEELVADRIFRSILDGNTTGIVTIDQAIKEEARATAKRGISQLAGKKKSA